MIDPDFAQWIVVPDDRSALPPVDEDIGDLKDFSSLEIPTDLRIDRKYGEPSGLLLGSDLCASQSADTFGAVTLPYETPPDAGQNAFFPVSDSSPSQVASYASLFPPALSPDSSPTSVASSTPWLRTPEADPSITDVISVHALRDITETKEESCSMVHFLDHAGNSLEDIPSEVQDMMLEDIACTPRIVSDPTLPGVFNTDPYGSLESVPQMQTLLSPVIFVTSPPCVSVSPTEVVPHGPVHYTPLSRSSPSISLPLLASSPAMSHTREIPLPGYSASLSLSPLSTLSFFSQSPNASPNPSPLVGCSSFSSETLPMPLSDDDGRVGVTDSVSSTFKRATLAKLRGKRSAGTLDDDSPPRKIPRRSKAKNVDEQEWNPSVRVKHARAVASSRFTRQNADCSQDESSNRETDQGSEGRSDTTHTNCEICGQQFTRPSDYIRHIENSASHPETRKVWPCPYCDSTLGRKDALGRHIKTMHAGRPVSISEGISGSQLSEGQREPSVQRIGQRKMPLMRLLRKGTRRYR